MEAFLSHDAAHGALPTLRAATTKDAISGSYFAPERHVPVEGRPGSCAHSEAGTGRSGGAAVVGNGGGPDWRRMACRGTRPDVHRAMTARGTSIDSFEHNEKEIHMKYRLLGNSGLRVSEAALGTMTFGDDWGWGTAKDEARKVYDAFREAGGNFIDTANLYTNGTSESFLGEFMEGHRQSVVLATKYTNAFPGTDPNAAGNQRKNMMQAVEASLKRLKTDYIDLYWVHIWDQITPVEEVMRGLDDLVRAGKVLYTGISDAPAWWIAQANTLAHLRGWSPFVGLQIEYSLIERTVERELIPMAKALNIGVTAWSPLAGGVLTGKYHGHGIA